MKTARKNALARIAESQATTTNKLVGLRAEEEATENPTKVEVDDPDSFDSDTEMREYYSAKLNPPWRAHQWREHFERVTPREHGRSEEDRQKLIERRTNLAMTSQRAQRAAAVDMWIRADRLEIAARKAYGLATEQFTKAIQECETIRKSAADRGK